MNSEAVRAIVLDIVREVLDADDAAAGSDFFELGGDSLAALEIAARVQERLDVEIPYDVIYELPTLGEFADAVAQGSARAPRD